MKVIDKVKKFNFNLGLQMNTILYTALCYSLKRKPVKTLDSFKQQFIQFSTVNKHFLHVEFQQNSWVILKTDQNIT